MVHASDALVLNKRDVDASATAQADAWARDLFPPKPSTLGARGAFDAAWLDRPRDAPRGDPFAEPPPPPSLPSAYPLPPDADHRRAPVATDHANGTRRWESHEGGRVRCERGA